MYDELSIAKIMTYSWWYVKFTQKQGTKAQRGE
jgi:hypothetical protein